MAPQVITTTTAPIKQAGSIDASAPVVLTATGDVWVKIYDADQKRLFEKEMVAGDSFNVPQNANKPMIVTGRPQALQITVGGKKVPPLGAPDKTVADVDISADGLLKRSAQAAVPEADIR